MKCAYYGIHCMNEAVGQAEINNEVLNICVDCAWEEYDQVDGNVEIVEEL